MNITTILAAFSFGGSSIISLLVWLLLAALAIYAVFLVLGMLPLPDPVKKIATTIFAVVFLFKLMHHLGITL